MVGFSVGRSRCLQEPEEVLGGRRASGRGHWALERDMGFQSQTHGQAISRKDSSEGAGGLLVGRSWLLWTENSYKNWEGVNEGQSVSYFLPVHSRGWHVNGSACVGLCL